MPTAMNMCRRYYRNALFGLLSALLLFAGCGTLGFLKKPEVTVMRSQNAEMWKNLRKLGRDGDWVVIRGYTSVDDNISALTGSPLSHAAVLDRQRFCLIESDRDGVHETAMEAFLYKAHRVLLVRPVWSKGKTGRAALLFARSLIGKPYDFTGLVGLNTPDTYYCSELAVKIYAPCFRQVDVLPAIVSPGELLRWGRILWDSGERE